MTSAASRQDWAVFVAEREWKRAHLAFEEQLAELEPACHGKAAMCDLIGLATKVRTTTGSERRRALRSLGTFAKTERLKGDTARALHQTIGWLRKAAESLDEANETLKGGH